MKTKIVYSLVSGPHDFYAYQAWISVMSLRHHCPDAYVELVCDSHTKEYIRSLPLFQLLDNIVCVNLPSGMTTKEISRQIKTNLRNIVQNDFLYLDVDTVITGPLDDIDGFQGSLFAVADAHCNLMNNPYIPMIRRNARTMGYSLENESSFFNGGVTYAKDDPLASDFYNKWNALYNRGTSKGIFIDQPSFAQANIILGHVMKEIPGIWNCQLRHGIRFLKDARIVHYLWTAKRAQNPFILGQQSVWEEIRATGVVPDFVKELFDDPFKGIQDLTYLASSEETAIFNSRLYKVMYKFEHESPTFYSILKLCVRGLDALYKLIHRKHASI